MDVDTRLLALADFLRQPWIGHILNAVCKDFYTSTDAGLALSLEDSAPWLALPLEWRTWAREQAATSETRDVCLRKLASGVQDEGYPASLNAFLKACSILQLPRAMSDEPVLSTTSRSARQLVATVENRFGMKAKKLHEVERSIALAHDVLDYTQQAHVLDVGAGRAHLSRSLTEKPVYAHVLAIDNSDTQLKGSERLVDLTNRFQSRLREGNDQQGSLTSAHCHLDEAEISKMLSNWPGREDGRPSLLLALHACGDLTVNALRAYLHAVETQPDRTLRMVVVGCCYNLMTPTSFPLSTVLRASPLPLDRDARDTAAQAPTHWVSSEAEWQRARFAIRKLAMRARCEAELKAFAHIYDETVVRVGRVRDHRYETYESFRSHAMPRLGYKADIPPPLPIASVEWVSTDDEDERYALLEYQLAIFWQLKSHIGPLIESLIVLDRYAYLVEGLRGTQRIVELYPLFDQDIGSLRNLALVVR